MNERSVQVGQDFEINVTITSPVIAINACNIHIVIENSDKLKINNVSPGSFWPSVDEFIWRFNKELNRLIVFITTAQNQLAASEMELFKIGCSALEPGTVLLDLDLKESNFYKSNVEVEGDVVRKVPLQVALNNNDNFYIKIEIK